MNIYVYDRFTRTIIDCPITNIEKCGDEDAWYYFDFYGKKCQFWNKCNRKIQSLEVCNHPDDYRYLVSVYRGNLEEIYESDKTLFAYFNRQINTLLNQYVG